MKGRKPVERSLIADYEYFHSAEIYGTGGRHFAFILPHILALKPGSLIDYGAGRSDIALRVGRKAGIKDKVARFDPAVPAVAQKPEGRFDLLISLDVLEHIPEKELDTVLDEMASMANHALHVIDIRPAKTILSDGRNAHVSLHDVAWWQARLAQHLPNVRHIPHHNRAVFKTWDAALPAWRHSLIEQRERLFRLIDKSVHTIGLRKERRLRRERAGGSI
jgi:hypothetical protein